MKLVFTGQTYIFGDKIIRRLFKKTNYNNIMGGGRGTLFEINFDK